MLLWSSELSTGAVAKWITVTRAVAEWIKVTGAMTKWIKVTGVVAEWINVTSVVVGWTKVTSGVGEWINVVVFEVMKCSNLEVLDSVLGWVTLRWALPLRLS